MPKTADGPTTKSEEQHAYKANDIKRSFSLESKRNFKSEGCAMTTAPGLKIGCTVAKRNFGKSPVAAIKVQGGFKQTTQVAPCPSIMLSNNKEKPEYQITIKIPTARIMATYGSNHKLHQSRWSRGKYGLMQSCHPCLNKGWRQRTTQCWRKISIF
jgi:hypothetical protein